MAWWHHGVVTSCHDGITVWWHDGVVASWLIPVPPAPASGGGSQEVPWWGDGDSAWGPPLGHPQQDPPPQNVTRTPRATNAGAGPRRAVTFPLLQVLGVHQHHAVCGGTRGVRGHVAGTGDTWWGRAAPHSRGDRQGHGVGWGTPWGPRRAQVLTSHAPATALTPCARLLDTVMDCSIYFYIFNTFYIFFYLFNTFYITFYLFNISLYIFIPFNVFLIYFYTFYTFLYIFICF